MSVIPAIARAKMENGLLELALKEVQLHDTSSAGASRTALKAGVRSRRGQHRRKKLGFLAALVTVATVVFVVMHCALRLKSIAEQSSRKLSADKGSKAAQGLGPRRRSGTS